jgi:hypothetical protein
MTTSPRVPSFCEKAVLDSGCTSTLITSSTHCTNKIPTTTGLRVGTANGQIMQASHQATLALPHLPIQLNSNVRSASVQPDLRKSLISLGQLCDHGCDYVLLDQHYASVIKDGVTSVIGLRDPTTGLWLIDVAPSGSPTRHRYNTPRTSTIPTAPTNHKQRCNSLSSYIEPASAPLSAHGPKPSRNIILPHGRASQPKRAQVFT